MELEEFLRGEAAVGQRESTGSFSVELNRAATKLGEFQLAEKGFYLLKVVQSLIGWDCQAIEIRSGRRATVVTATFPRAPQPEWLPAPELFLPCLLSSRDGPDRDLAIAVSSALSFQPEELNVTSTQGGLSFNRERATSTTAAGKQFTLTVKGGARDRAAEGRAVRNRCRYASVPVSFNGESAQKLGWSHSCSKPLPGLKALGRDFSLVESYVVDGGLGRDGIPMLVNGSTLLRAGADLNSPVKPIAEEVTCFLRQIDLRVEQGWRFEGGPKVPGSVPFSRVPARLPMCRALLALTTNWNEPGVLQYVKKGVLLDALEGPAGSRALLCGRDIAVDLSQFRPVVKQDDLDTVRHYLQQMTKLLKLNYKSFRVPRPGTSGLGVMGGLLGLAGLHPAVAMFGYRCGTALHNWIHAGLKSASVHKEIEAYLDWVESQPYTRTPPLW